MSGQLEIICGPMFSGKSEELIRRLRRAQIAKQKIIIYKPKIDNRYSVTSVVSHSGMEIEAESVNSSTDILFDYVKEQYDVIGIDEAQFFEEHILDDIKLLVNSGARVIVSGLDQDYRGEGFTVMPELMARADSLVKLSAVCVICGENATKTQRLLNGEPAPLDGDLVIIGGDEQYQARCRNCWRVG